MAQDAQVETLTIRIPMRLQRRGGRKLIITPEGAAPPPKPRRDGMLIKALVRAHRWRRRVESGQAKSITDLAEQEGVTVAYVCRLLPLTCVAPDIVEAILDGRAAEGAEADGDARKWAARLGGAAEAVIGHGRYGQTCGSPSPRPIAGRSPSLLASGGHRPSSSSRASASFRPAAPSNQDRPPAREDRAPARRRYAMSPGAGQRPLPSPPPSALGSADKSIYTKNWTLYPIRGKYLPFDEGAEGMKTAQYKWSQSEGWRLDLP